MLHCQQIHNYWAWRFRKIDLYQLHNLRTDMAIRVNEERNCPGAQVIACSL